MLTGSYDSHVAIWDLRASGRDPLQVLRDSKDSITSVSITDRGKIISASVDGAVRIYDIRAGKLISDNRNCPITSCRAVNNESCILSCCLNNCIYLSEISTGDILKTYTG
jgi:mitogen-activated protein kinase organizer 1